MRGNKRLTGSKMMYEVGILASNVVEFVSCPRKLMDIKALEEEISKFIYELENEDRLVRVGLKDNSESSKVYKKYSKLFSKEILSKIRLEIAKGSGGAKGLQRDLFERIYTTLVSSYIGLQLASDSDKITTYFSGASVSVLSDKIPYFQLSSKISKEPIYDKRELYDDAAASVVAKINSKKLELLKAEIKLMKELGYSSYISFYTITKKVDYPKFYKIVAKTKKDTDKVWQNTIGKVSKEVLKREFVKIKSCHLTYLRSLSMYDNYYPVEKVVTTFEKWTRDIGLFPLLKNIKIDDVNRAKKNPRAVCYWPDPPTEIHLVIKPIGGEQDYEAVFHEGGHALHGSAIDSALPYPLKALSYSNALTETFAFVLEDLVFDPDFLTTYLNVSTFTGNKIKQQAYFVNLMMLRRYLGKFSYEYEMFKNGVFAKGPTLYAKNLQEATGFISNKANWLSDMDGGFYSADYLRAWIAAAQIKDYLVKRFGKRWFLNKKAGEFLRKLYSRGVTDEVEDVVKKLGYKPWDISFLLQGYKEVLK